MSFRLVFVRTYLFRAFFVSALAFTLRYKIV